MTTHIEPRGTGDRAPIVVLVSAAAVGAALFAACTTGEVAAHGVVQCLPSLVVYGLAMLVALPLFAASLTAAWRSSR